MINIKMCYLRNTVNYLLYSNWECLLVNCHRHTLEHQKEEERMSSTVKILQSGVKIIFLQGYHAYGLHILAFFRANCDCDLIWRDVMECDCVMKSGKENKIKKHSLQLYTPRVHDKIRNNDNLSSQIKR